MKQYKIKELLFYWPRLNIFLVTTNYYTWDSEFGILFKDEDRYNQNSNAKIMFALSELKNLEYIGEL